MKKLSIQNNTEIMTTMTADAKPKNGQFVAFSRLKTILASFMVMFMVFACEDPFMGTTFTAYEDLPMSLYLDSRPDDFSQWVAMLKYTDLYNTLNLNTSYTAFTPTNAAIDDYLESKGVGSVEELDKDETYDLVLYHIIHGIVLTQSQFTTGTIERATALGDKLSVSFRAGGIVYINNVSKISEPNITVTNGIIHAIDNVLIPISATIYDRMLEDEYSIMREAIDITGLDSVLTKVQEKVLNASGDSVINRFYYSFFAVSNTTFAADGVNSFSDLTSKLNVQGTDYKNKDNALYKYVAYHILDQLKSTDKLALVDGETSRNINTMANQELINITNTAQNQIQFNYDQETNESIQILEADITCKNGVIHVVDNYMPIKNPPATNVIWELTDYAELASVCSYFQSAFPNGGSSSYSKTLERDEISIYTWESVPDRESGVVTYVNNRNNDGVYYFAENHDHLLLNTGISGWVEMPSPVIVKGTYSMEISYISYFSTELSGEMQCYLDGVKLGSSFKISNTDQDKIASQVLTSSITFDETVSHKLRIVGIDGRKLTLDYIQFKPIN